MALMPVPADLKITQVHVTYVDEGHAIVQYLGRLFLGTANYPVTTSPLTLAGDLATEGNENTMVNDLDEHADVLREAFV